MVTARRSVSVLLALANLSPVQMGQFKTKQLSPVVTFARLVQHARLEYRRSARRIVSVTRLFQRHSPTVNFVRAEPFRKTQPKDLVQLATAQIAQLSNSVRLEELSESVQQATFVLTVQMPTNQTSQIELMLALVAITANKAH